MKIFMTFIPTQMYMIPFSPIASYTVIMNKYCRKFPIAKEHQKKPNTFGPMSRPNTVEEKVGAMTRSPPRQQLNTKIIPK